MDSLTHLAVGAVVGELAAGKQYGGKARLWGAIISAFPDIDILFQWLFSPGSSLLFHRGVTHSLLFCLLASFLAARWINQYYKGNRQTYKTWLKLSLFSYLSHLLIDVLNTYGIALLYPLRPRIAFDSMAVVDILFLFIFLFGSILLYVYRKNKKLRKSIVLVTLTVGTFYLGFSVANKLIIEQKARQTLTVEGHSLARVRATPLPLSNFVWKVLAEDEERQGFWQSNYSIVARQPMRFTYIKSQAFLADSLMYDKEFERIKRFSKGFYAIAEDSQGEKYFCDLRFSSFDFDGTTTPMNAVIRFELRVGDDGKLNLEKTYPRRTFSKENFRKHYRQVVGSKKITS